MLTVAFQFNFCAFLSSFSLAHSVSERQLSATVVTGIISTMAGTGISGYSGDGGNATAAKLNFPLRTAFGATDNVYIVDYIDNRIRMVSTSEIGRAHV